MSKKKTDGWMPLYVADYLADTTRLTTEQHGAYLLLIIDYWRNGPPETDDQTLASITKLTVAQWRKHAPKLLAMFHIKDGKLWHKRIEQERAKAGVIIDARREAGKLGAIKRWGEKKEEDEANAIANEIANAMANAIPDGMANDMANEWQSTSQTDAPLTVNRKPLPTRDDDGGSPARTRARDAPPVDNSESSSSSFDEAAIGNCLTAWERDRGKTPRVAQAQARFARWREEGLRTEAQLRAAYDAAVAQRERDHDPSAINAGFLDAFIAKSLAPPKPATNGHAPPDAGWWQSASGITAQGETLGLHQAPDEPFPTFKARVFRASGDGPWAWNARGTVTMAGAIPAGRRH